jgi:uncharacterized protein (DUF302 family)
LRVTSLVDRRVRTASGIENHSAGVTVEQMSEYGFSVAVREGYDEAVVRTRLALRSEGFSILTEAHVGEMLGRDGASERQYLIMGAYASTEAQSVGDPSIEVGFHLPCNVVVHESDVGAIVAALDPADTVEGDDETARGVASAARAALERVLRKVESPD